MARSIRIEYEGAYYHVMARGNHRSAIFLDDDDHLYFLATLEEACEKTGWRVHAWVLMKSHYHLLIETPEANLVEGMKWLQNTYTRRFNVRHKEWGRLFGDRYKAILVDGKSPYYYETMIDYIHLNPVRAGLLSFENKKSVLDYRWSSLAGGYALPGNGVRLQILTEVHHSNPSDIANSTKLGGKRWLSSLRLVRANCWLTLAALFIFS